MKALEGIKVLDFTHVQSGPTCTQLLGWLGADVIKVERPGVGDATRKQLVDVEGADSLYFTMLNHTSRPPVGVGVSGHGAGYRYKGRGRIIVRAP